MASMSDVFGLNEAQAGDPGLLDGLEDVADRRLGDFHWDKAPRGSGLGDFYLTKRVRGVRCVAVLLTADQHAFITGRGRAGVSKGYIVDVEVLRRDDTNEHGHDGEFIYHMEKRTPDFESGQALWRRVMDFIDASTLRDLVSVPRSGPNAMTAWRG